MSDIKNLDLTLDKIPKTLEDGGMYFALSFDGYANAGSPKGCFDVANKTNQAIENKDTSCITLSELRTSLFAHARALHFSSGSPDKKIVDNLLLLIRKRVKENNLG